MKRPHISVYKVTRNLGDFVSSERQIGSGDFRRVRGVVITPLGLVSVDAWYPIGEHGKPATYFVFVHDGREHHRRDDRVFSSNRSLVAVAGRWARDIAGGAS